MLFSSYSSSNASTILRCILLRVMSKAFFPITPKTLDETSSPLPISLHKNTQMQVSFHYFAFLAICFGANNAAAMIATNGTVIIMPIEPANP